MGLIISNFLRKRSLNFLLFLSVVSVFELKPSVTSADVPVSIKRQAVVLLTTLGFISVSFIFLYIVMKKITNHNRKPIIKEDAKQILNLKGDEKFIGEIHDGPRTIFNIIKHCNTFDSLDEKKEFLSNCHSNFIFHGPPGAGKNHAVLWLKYLLDEEGIKDVPFSVVKEVETSFVGGGANTLTDVFEKTAKEASKTKNKIAVIIFDELASVIPERSVMLPAMSKTSDQLLKLTDGFESSFGDVFFIIIGLTNHLAQIDKAFKSRSCCIEFLPNKKAIKKVIKANFSDNFLKECKVLKECLDNKYCFGITGKPLAIRDLLNIKKNLFQKTVTQHGCEYKNFNAIPNKVELFHQCYELKNTDEFGLLLMQKF